MSSSSVSSTSNITTYTGTSGAGGGTKLRITGLATGLDVDATITKMLTADQTKIDQANQAKQTLTWKQEAYQSIITDIKALQSAYFDVANSSTNILSSTNYAAADVNIPDASTGIITATAGSSAKAGSYTVSFGTDGHLASKAAIAGSTNLTVTSGSTTNTATASATMAQLGLTETSTIAFNYNGSTTPTSITVKTTDKISDVINNISSATSGAVTASFSELTGKFTLQTSVTGSDKNLQISDSDPTSAESILGLTDTTQHVGQDAVVNITSPDSATATTVTRSSNNFTIDGVTYNLQTKNDSSFTITADTGKVYDKIKAFIDKYNTVVDEIQTKLSEKKDSKYPPLTATQEAAMTDSQITAWNTKAKAGILRNDDGLTSLLTSLRQAFNTGIKDSSGNNVTSLYFGNSGAGAIGLDTSDTYSDGGKITINETTLKNAIINYGDQVIKFFTNTSTSTDATTKFNESGVFERLSTILKDNVGAVGTTSSTSATLTKFANLQDDHTSTGTGGTNTLPDQIYNEQLLITKLTDAMADKKEALYLKFSKLETAMNNLNTQQSTLSSMLGS